MATVKYRIKDTAKDPTVIYIRFRHTSEHDYEIPTGLDTYKKEWSVKKEAINRSGDNVEYADKINSKLRDFKNFVINQFNLAQSEGITLSRTWLERCLQDFFNRAASRNQVDKSIYFSDFDEWFISFAKDEIVKKTKRKRSARTIQDYNTTLKKIHHFQKVKNYKYKHSEIDSDFHRDFINYCQEIHGNNEKTIGGEIDNIRLFLKRADAEGCRVSKDYKLGLLVSPDNDTHDIALNERDIKKIQSCIFTTDSDRLDNARDWLVIGIWTGLRVSDLLNLDMSKCDGDFFELQNKKTGIYVVIPVHKEVRKILKRRNGFPRKISAAKFNKYIKEVAKIAGLTDMTMGAKKIKTTINGYGDKPKISYRKVVKMYPKHELVTSHICRRTFATIHYGKLDTLTIMKIIGHRTEKQFLEYVKITPRQHAEKMKELWNKMYKDEQQ